MTDKSNTQAAHIAYLQQCLREVGHCIDGGACHHNCGPKGKCFRQDGCVPLSASGLANDWTVPASLESYSRHLDAQSTPEPVAEGLVVVDMVPPATARDRWMYEQGRLAERDARTPADSLASAGGVEVVAYLVSGGRIFKDQAVTHKDSARTRIAERKDGSVAHPLVKQSDYLAALSKEREVADGLAEALRVLLDYKAESAGDGWLEMTVGADDYQAAQAALAAHRESRGAASEAKEG